MKIIEQSHTWIKEPDPIKLIELAGRNCYKSENKITEDSANKFVKMLTKSGHHSVLEHTSICFKLECTDSWLFVVTQPFRYLRWTTEKDRTLISGNFRAWLNFIKAIGTKTPPTNIANILAYLHESYPIIFPKPLYEYKQILPYIASECLMYPREKLIHATRTCRFITNRGVTHELVRHRPWAYSQESTRYVRYNSDMEFIKPVWCSDQVLGVHTIDWINLIGTRLEGQINPELPPAENVWFWNQAIAERDYCNLLDCGWKPEQAREVLPNSLKTEIVCTAPLSEWRHMLRLRTSKAAHPQMRALMEPVLSDLKEELPDLF